MGFLEIAAALKFFRTAELGGFSPTEYFTYDLVLGRLGGDQRSPAGCTCSMCIACRTTRRSRTSAYRGSSSRSLFLGLACTCCRPC